MMAASLVAGWGAAQAQGGHPADRRLPFPAPSPLLPQPSIFAAATLRGCVAAPLLPYIFNTSTLHLVPLILLTPSWTPEAFPLAFPPLLLSPLPSSPIPSLPPLPPSPAYVGLCCSAGHFSNTIHFMSDEISDKNSSSPYQKYHVLNIYHHLTTLQSTLCDFMN